MSRLFVMPRLITASLASALLMGAASPPALALATCRVRLGHTDIATNTNPQPIVTGDFNKDGKLDFALVNYSGGGAGTVSVYLGNGDGTFQPKTDYSVGAGPDALATADLNGDGILDLVTGNDTATSVSVLIGNGDGTFKPKVNYNVGPFPHWVAIADFNGDHAPDIAVANEGSNTVGVLLNNGDGTFGTMTTYPTPEYPYSVAAADFNGDGKIDLAVTGYNDSVIGILIGNGDGTFKPYSQYPTGTAPAVVLAYDFNRDKKIDLATVNYTNGETGSVSILLGNGDGTFGTYTDYPVGLGPDGAAIGKFEGSKHADLAVANLIGNTMSILAGHGDGTFGPPKSYPTAKYPLGVAAGRFHGQSATSEDLVVSNDLAAEAIFFTNKGCR